MNFSVQRIFSHCRSRVDALSPPSEDAIAKISPTTSATVFEPESGGSDTKISVNTIGNTCRKSQPEPSIGKPSRAPNTRFHSLDEQANFTWQDIDPPEDFSRSGKLHMLRFSFNTTTSTGDRDDQ
ncbi:hypothetical protein PHISCL_03541 [Aspergillus sclerotialis]|uniref:Uncharacterized protein n=1 Tax=Aspergillus sclerotialis TaxID=2070753 RepID=A0A3A2ZM48_9EURO|nr:hypothetical protein PHISCL_03541 [Aspergillus sclerotialis]